MGRKRSLIPGFSLNRALGVTSAKQRFARATGIPTTKAGRKRKAQSYLWTAVAAGVCAAASGTKAGGQRQSYAGSATGEPRCCPYCGQELDGPTAQCPHCGRTLQQQNVQLRKPGPLRILLAVILSLMVISSVARKISPKPATGDVDGERLNVSNAAELAPDVQLNQEVQPDEPIDDGDQYYTEEEQAAAAEAYYESIGGNPHESGGESHIETDGNTTYIFHSSDEPAPSQTTAPTAATYTYTLNTNSMVFHRSTCSRAKKIKDENRATATGTREEMINMGYTPCGSCHP